MLFMIQNVYCIADDNLGEDYLNIDNWYNNINDIFFNDKELISTVIYFVDYYNSTMKLCRHIEEDNYVFPIEHYFEYGVLKQAADNICKFDTSKLKIDKAIELIDRMQVFIMASQLHLTIISDNGIVNKEIIDETINAIKDRYTFICKGSIY